jgi:deoxycytidylate deaminase
MDYFVLEAKKQALKSPMKNQYGAVLVYKGKIVSSGYNYYTCIKSNDKCPLCG